MPLSHLQKSEINKAVANTQVFIKSMLSRLRADSYSHTIAAQDETLAKIRIKNEMNISDPSGAVLAGLGPISDDDELAELLWDVQSKLQEYDNEIDNLKNDPKKTSIKTVCNMLNDIDACTVEFNMFLLKIEMDTLHVEKDKIDWFNLSIPEVVQQIFNVNNIDFGLLLKSDDFELLLEANGGEYLKEIKRYMKKTHLTDNDIAKDRFNAVNNKFMRVRERITTHGNFRKGHITEQLTKNLGKGRVITNIQALINILDQQCNHQLKFFNKDNSEIKKEFLQNVVQLVKKHDSLLSKDDKTLIWEKVGKSKVVGYHRAGINANSSYFGLSGKKTEAMKFCESLSKGVTDVSYRGTSYEKMQLDVIEQSVSHTFTK